VVEPSPDWFYVPLYHRDLPGNGWGRAHSKKHRGINTILAINLVSSRLNKKEAGQRRQNKRPGYTDAAEGRSNSFRFPILCDTVGAEQPKHPGKGSTWEMAMKTIDHLQKMALTYQEICQGEQPWVALGNFINDWFGYATDRRAQLIADPITLPASPDEEQFRWAVFCAASVEYLCHRYEIPCPSWVENDVYRLPEPWFDIPRLLTPPLRERLLQTTPEPFARRNMFCGDRVFANKYECIEQYRRSRATLLTEASYRLTSMTGSDKFEHIS